MGVVGSEVRTTRTVTGSVTPAPGLTTTSYADAADLKIGLGTRASMRVEWERYPDIGTASTGVVDLDVYSVGVMLRLSEGAAAGEAVEVAFDGIGDARVVL